jgi:hypothetical protein
MTIIAPPAINPAIAKGTRAPRRSIMRPMTQPESANPIRRAVCAIPKIEVPTPSSSRIGLMKRPRLTPPMPVDTAPTAISPATMTQP